MSLQIVSSTIEDRIIEVSSQRLRQLVSLPQDLTHPSTFLPLDPETKDCHRRLVAGRRRAEPEGRVAESRAHVWRMTRWVEEDDLTRTTVTMYDPFHDMALV
jgi:hypothetical protein